MTQANHRDRRRARTSDTGSGGAVPATSRSRRRRLPMCLAGLGALVVGLAVPAVGAVPAGAIPESNPSGPVACSVIALVAAMADAIPAYSPVTLDLAPGCTYDVTVPYGPVITPDSPPSGENAFAAVASGVNITIVGDGATITRSGADDFRFFSVEAGGALTLDNLTLSDGDDATTAGGGAVNNDGSLTADDVDFASNTSDGAGGAIGNGYQQGNDPTVTVTGSTFAGNTSTNFVDPFGGGGAISNAIDDGTGTVTVTGSTFVDNDAAGDLEFGGGGAIENADQLGTGTLSVSDSTFDDNTASLGGFGGAIDTGFEGDGTASVVASTFDGNTADLGEALFSEGGQLALAADLVAGPSDQCFGGDTDDGYNLVSDSSCGLTQTTSTVVPTLSSDLQALANNGGPTETNALATTSDPAVGAIPLGTTATVNGSPVTLCSRTDQRGDASAGPCSIGAFEQVAFELPPGSLAGLGTGGGGTAPSVVVVLSQSQPEVPVGAVTADLFSVAVAGSAGTPTGTVAVTAGPVTLCTVTLANGQGSCTATNPAALAQGAYQVVAVYSGDSTYGTASSSALTLAVVAGPVAAATAATSAAAGYWLAGQDGAVFAYGYAGYFGGANTANGGSGPGTPIVAVAVTADGDGYWLAGQNGAVFAYGDATYMGGANTLNGGAGPGSPIVAMAVTADGGGYWEVAQDGAVFDYGDAGYFGGANTANSGAGPGQAVVAMTPTPDGGGYWEVGQNGAVFAYGDAQYVGGANTVAGGVGSPIVGIAPGPDAGGYWEVAQDGAVFAYGDVAYDGGANTLNGGAGPGTAVTAITSTLDGGGYVLAGADGAVFTYGDAVYQGGANAGSGAAAGRAPAAAPTPGGGPDFRRHAPGREPVERRPMGERPPPTRPARRATTAVPAPGNPVTGASPVTAAAGRAATARGPAPPGVDLAAAVTHLRRADRRLASLIDAVGGCGLRTRPSGSTVAALAESIVYQQLTGRAAATIHGRLCALFPRPSAGPTARGLLALADDDLRAAGLSAAKVAALKDLAQRAAARQVPSLRALTAMDDEEVIERLTAVRGIGRWTVEMLLIFRLGRPDVLAVDDYGLRKGLGALLEGGPPAPDRLPGRDDLRAAGEPWRPYRSVASWYLWRAAERPELAGGRRG